MHMTTAMLQTSGNAEFFSNFALAASAALFFITLIVCWIRSGRNKRDKL